MPGRSLEPAAEWVGGTVTMPTTITGEGKPYRPDMLLWVDPANEIILGMTVGRPDELPDLAAENLEETIARPAMGPPGPPKRVRVGSEALAEPLRAAFPDLEIVVGDTAVIDTVGAALIESFPDAAETEWSWLADGLPGEAVGDFFDAMAALWHAEPWSFVAIGDSLFSVTVDAFDVRDAVAAVIGQMGESAGVLLFASLAAHDRFALVGEAMQRGDLEAALEHGGDTGMPAHVGLSFDAVDEVAPTLLEEREAHGWTLADEQAFPSLLCFEANMRSRAPAARDLAIAQALARAFAGASEEDGLFDAMRSPDEPLERTLTVPTSRGEVEVTLRGPIRSGVGTNEERSAVKAVPEQVYRLKIELEAINREEPEGEVSRTVELSGEDSLWDLHAVIQQIFDWDDDHLFAFFVSGKLRDRKSSYVGSPEGDIESWSDEPRSVEETRLADLGLKRRRVMRYVFDEHIVHKITVSTIRAGELEDTALPRLVGSVGEVPPQYDFEE